MDSQLIAFIQSAYESALDNGLTPTFPVSLLYGTTYQSRVIVVSHTEPSDLVLPINVIWVNVNSSSIDYMKALKRVSKEDSVTYAHTWQTLALFEQVTDYEQVFDATDILRSTPQQDVKFISEKDGGLPKQLLKSGDTATGPINARTLASGQSYASNEFIPRSFVVSQISSQTNGFYGILLPMNTRLQNAESAINNNTLRITALEQGAPTGVTPFVFTITEENNSLSMNIQHNKNTMNVSVTVLAKEGTEETPLYSQVGVHGILAYHLNFVLVEVLMLLPVGSKIIVYPAAAS